MLLSPLQPGDLVRTVKPWFWTEELPPASIAAALGASVVSSGFVYTPYVPLVITPTVVAPPPASYTVQSTSVTHIPISSPPSFSQTFPRNRTRSGYAKKTVNPSNYTTVSLTTSSRSGPTPDDPLLVLSFQDTTLRIMMVDGRIFRVTAACLDDIMRDFELLGASSAWVCEQEPD